MLCSSRWRCKMKEPEVVVIGEHAMAQCSDSCEVQKPMEGSSLSNGPFSQPIGASISHEPKPMISKDSKNVVIASDAANLSRPKYC